MKIAVVGTCASGKTTVVARLRVLGHNAYVVSQEHSIVRDLWLHQQPDALVFLESDYQTVCLRRGGSWPRWLFDLQNARLVHARVHADLVVNTASLSIEETIETISMFIRRRHEQPSS